MPLDEICPMLADHRCGALIGSKISKCENTPVSVKITVRSSPQIDTLNTLRTSCHEFPSLELEAWSRDMVTETRKFQIAAWQISITSCMHGSRCYLRKEREYQRHFEQPVVLDGFRPHLAMLNVTTRFEDFCVVDSPIYDQFFTFRTRLNTTMCLHRSQGPECLRIRPREILNAPRISFNASRNISIRMSPRSRAHQYRQKHELSPR
ncbi:hypothetical protein K474DRAFT_1192171 [Panus rudis PR-1116 ss-1]|nr:hypothetical protein K474DRAFT_1192171 [Panus rudis PR-1116 ss-1]